MCMTSFVWNPVRARRAAYLNAQQQAAVSVFQLLLSHVHLFGSLLLLLQLTDVVD